MAYPKGLEQHHLTLSKDVSASACWTNHSSSVRGETIILWSEQRASFPEHWDQHKWRPLDALSPEDLGKTQRFSDWDEMNSEVSTGWLRSLCWKSCLLISLEPYILLSAQHFNLFSGFFASLLNFNQGREGQCSLRPSCFFLCVSWFSSVGLASSSSFTLHEIWGRPNCTFDVNDTSLGLRLAGVTTTCSYLQP